jgi:nitrogen fixation NifU-like protein
MTADIYKETILDHYRHPRNYGDLPNANARAKDSNVLCGDVIEMQLRVNANTIEDARFRGEGCAISMATASMLTEFSKGKSISEIRRVGKEEVVKLLGTDPGPARVECVLLGLNVLKAAIAAQLSVGVPEKPKHK